MFNFKSVFILSFFVATLLFGASPSPLFRVEHYATLNRLVELRSSPVSAAIYAEVIQGLSALPKSPQRQYEKDLRLFFAEKAYSKQYYTQSLELISGIDFTGTQRFFQQNGMKVIAGLIDQGFTPNDTVIEFALKYPGYFSFAELKKMAVTNDQILKVFERLATLPDTQMAMLWSEYCKSQDIDSAHFWLSESKRLMKKKELEGSKIACKKSLERDPFLTSATLQLVEIYEKEGNREKAMRTLDPVVKSRVLFSGNAKHISKLWLDLHKVDDPTLTLQSLIERERVPETMVPNVLLWQLGFDSYRNKDYPKAMKWLSLWEPKSSLEKAQRLYWMYRTASMGNIETYKAQQWKRQCMTDYPDTVYALFLAQNEKEFHPLYKTGYLQPVAIPMEVKSLVKDGYGKWFAEDLKCELKVASAQEKFQMAMQAASLFKEESLYRDSLNAMFRGDVPWGDSGRGVNLTLLSLYYPTPFHHHVVDLTKDRQVEQAYIFAIMREESAFEPKAVSSSGARGLMQLMPKTAAGIAKQLKTHAYSVDKLFRPETNIEFGTSYLEYLHKRFNGNPLWMASGYNAGPNITAKWVKVWGDLPMDEQLELIPYDETNAYAKRVLRSYWVYQELMKQQALMVSTAQ